MATRYVKTTNANCKRINKYHRALPHPLRWYICAIKWYVELIIRKENSINDPNPAKVSSRTVLHIMNVVNSNRVSKENVMADHNRWLPINAWSFPS